MSRKSRTQAEKLALYHLRQIVLMSLEDGDALPGQVVKLCKRSIKLMDHRPPTLVRKKVRP